MDNNKNWEVVRVYYGLLSTMETVIRKELTKEQAEEMASRLDSNPGSSSTVYIARRMK